MESILQFKPPARSSGYARIGGETYAFSNGELSEDGRARLTKNKALDHAVREELRTAILGIILEDSRISDSDIYAELYRTDKLPEFNGARITEERLRREVTRVRRDHRLHKTKQSKVAIELLFKGNDDAKVIDSTGLHKETVRKIRRALYRPDDPGCLRPSFVRYIQSLAVEVRKNLKEENV